MIIIEKMSNIEYQISRSHKAYLALLRAALWGDNELTNERMRELTKEEVNEVIRLAGFQGTGPLVYDQLLKLKDVNIHADLRMQMKQQCVHSMMLQQSMFGTLSQAWNALVAADVHPVLLKGFALAQYYPQPHLRQWGDIDLYVGQKQYHAACKVLQTTFPNADHPAEEDEERKHYNFILPNTVLELHRISMAFAHPRDRKYYEGLEERYLTKDGLAVEVDGLLITMPDDTFNLFFTFLHAWHHFIETGMNMKQLCDIAILLHAKREAINQKQLHEMLTKLHLMEPWQLMMYIMVHYLGVPQKESPFYTEKNRGLAELLFTRIMSEGSSRRPAVFDTKGMPYIKRKWLTFQLRRSDGRLVRPYAPRYARRMIIGDLLHGFERLLKRK